MFRKLQNKFSAGGCPFAASRQYCMFRFMFRFRARAIKGVKYNTKGSYTKLDCRLCLGPPETQEHLQECPGAGFERRGLKLEEEVDLITFWRRISVKLQGFGLST